MPGIDYEEVAQALFEGMLGRRLESPDLDTYVAALEAGASLRQMIEDICHSEEFAATRPQVSDLVVTLPDLTQLYPSMYRDHGDGTTIYNARNDSGIAFMEGLISKHRYYDSFGIWVPEVDTDKRITAAIIEALGADSVIELGCFAGAALSLMKGRGLDVCGVEVSHRAFLLADDGIVGDMKYGDLLDLPIERTFDSFLGMDILEHLSPLKLGRYVEKIRNLIGEDGFAYINAPMFGEDRTFGTVFRQYLPSWAAVGDACYWYEMHCDAMGWPMHGHLVWASPQWWERLFADQGLVRDDRAETMLHSAMEPFFTSSAPARKSFFVLRSGASKPDYALIEQQIAR